jgi:hypothetical protein
MNRVVVVVAAVDDHVGEVVSPIASVVAWFVVVELGDNVASELLRQGRSCNRVGDMDARLCRREEILVVRDRVRVDVLANAVSLLLESLDGRRCHVRQLPRLEIHKVELDIHQWWWWL